MVLLCWALAFNTKCFVGTIGGWKMSWRCWLSVSKGWLNTSPERWVKDVSVIVSRIRRESYRHAFPQQTKMRNKIAYFFLPHQSPSSRDEKASYYAALVAFQSTSSTILPFVRTPPCNFTENEQHVSLVRTTESRCLSRWTTTQHTTTILAALSSTVSCFFCCCCYSFLLLLLLRFRCILMREHKRSVWVSLFKKQKL